AAGRRPGAAPPPPAAPRAPDPPPPVGRPEPPPAPPRRSSERPVGFQFGVRAKRGLPFAVPHRCPGAGEDVARGATAPGCSHLGPVALRADRPSVCGSHLAGDHVRRHIWRRVTSHLRRASLAAIYRCDILRCYLGAGRHDPTRPNQRRSGALAP
ncbi:hypothetical protein FJ693_11880, partial [Georgenia yuyongxinii]